MMSVPKTAPSTEATEAHLFCTGMEVICWIVNTMSVTPHILNAQIIIVFHGGGFAIRSGTVRVGLMKKAALTENHVQDNTDVMNRVSA